MFFAMQGAANIVEAPKKEKVREAASDDELVKLKQTLKNAVEAQRLYSSFTQEQVKRSNCSFLYFPTLIFVFRYLC